MKLEVKGFSICNTDGTEGLTLNEINDCKVYFNFVHFIMKHKFRLMIHIFEIQTNYGDFLVYAYWPTEDQYAAADDNNDGNLTINEYILYLLGN